MNPTDFIDWALRGLRAISEYTPGLFAGSRKLYLTIARGRFGPESDIVEQIDEILPTSPADALGDPAGVEMGM
jgi:hypothetical protein